MDGSPTGAHRELRLSGRRKSSVDREIRSEFERDVDRVTYSFFFRRLAGVTQVSSGQGKILVHNRMTHSLKVAQVGRRLVQYLQHDAKEKGMPGLERAGEIDRNVVSAAGMLHDIGHPPYGHIAEKQLDRIAQAHDLADGYEGNAQTLRILLSLASHMPGDDDTHVTGLDLTRAVVAACVKYPYSRENSPDGIKWGYYEPEASLFSSLIEPLLPEKGKPTLEAEIMDWADDITYAVHDLQDFYMNGITPLHHLRHYSVGGGSYKPVNEREFDDFWDYVVEKIRSSVGVPTHTAKRKFALYASEFPEGSYGETRDESARMARLASKIITHASLATEVKDDGSLKKNDEMEAVIRALKEITWYYVIDHPDLVTRQLGQRAEINQVFNRTYNRVKYSFTETEKMADGQEHVLNENERWLRRRRLPAPLREYVEQLLNAKNGEGAYETRKQCYARASIDYIASMTEAEFQETLRRVAPVEYYRNVDDSDFYPLFGD